MKTTFKLIVTSLLAIPLISISSSLNAQIQQATYNNPIKWYELKSVDGIAISYYKGDCNSSEALFLKIENQTDNTIELTWSLWSSSESKTTTILPRQIRIAECMNSGEYLLIDFIPAGQSINSLTPSVTVTVKN